VTRGAKSEEKLYNFKYFITLKLYKLDNLVRMKTVSLSGSPRENVGKKDAKKHRK
jgi:hypothetical protein